MEKHRGWDGDRNGNAEVSVKPQILNCTISEALDATHVVAHYDSVAYVIRVGVSVE